MLDTSKLKRAVLCGLMLLIAASNTGCRSAPVTGRRQLSLLPEQQEVLMGASAYQEVIATEKQSTNPQYVDLVNRVGQRIAAVSGRPDYQWEFRVLASPQQNAFCLPGGKVAVYEGILPICENEAGLAVVMSHEIGHALARHGGERISQGYAVEGVRKAMAYVTQTQQQHQRDLVMRAYGAASHYGVILPYSRTHETEADHIGLMMMAKAGYDPQEAPRFWNRFAASNSGPKQPEFASTHPNDEHRAQQLAQLLPEAQRYYESVVVKLGQGESIPGINGMANTESLAQHPEAHRADVLQPATAAGYSAGPAVNLAPSGASKNEGWMPARRR